MKGASPRRKGNGFERELVQAALAIGLSAERAYGSNGRALGLSEQVDVLIDGCGIQAKRVKSLSKRLTEPLEDPDVYAVAFREDRGQTLVLIDLDTFLALRRLCS